MRERGVGQREQETEGEEEREREIACERETEKEKDSEREKVCAGRRERSQTPKVRKRACWQEIEISSSKTLFFKDCCFGALKSSSC